MDKDAMARTIAAVRDISTRQRPDGLDSLGLAAWYAEQFGALLFHAETLAAEVEQQIGK